MSIQAVIDRHIQQNYYNITVKDEQGNADIPENANVSFFNCKINKLTVHSNSAVFIGRSKVLGKVYAEACSFIAEDTAFMDEIIWKKNTVVKKMERCTFYFRIKMYNNTQATIFNCGWDGFGSFGILANDKCRVTISRCTVTKRTKGLWAQKGSYFDCTDVTIGTAIGLIAEEDSQINFIKGVLNVTDIAVQGKQRSQVYLAALKSPVRASTLHVDMEDNCKLMASETDFAPLPPTSIRAKNKCLIEVVNCGFIKSSGGDCIDIQDNCTARFIKIGDINSQGATAIAAKSGCTVDAIEVTNIKGDGQYGVKLEDRCKFEAAKGTLIKGAISGIKADTESSVSADHTTTIKGDGGPGIELSNDSHGYLSKVTDVIGGGGDGIKLSNESDISLQDHGSVNGVAGHGINATSDCTIQLQTVKKVTGTAGHGINADSNTTVDVIYTDLLEGLAGVGVNATTNCDVKVTRSKKLTGTIGGAQVVTGGSLFLERINQILPDGGNGVICSADVEVKIQNIDLIKKGMNFNNCDVKLKDCPSILNDSGAAIQVNSGEIDIKSIVAVGSGSSLLLNGTILRAVGTTLTGDIESHTSQIELDRVSMVGNINSDNDEYVLRKFNLLGNVDSLNCNYHTSMVNFIGNTNMITTTMEIEKSTLLGTINATASSRIELESSTATGAVTLAAVQLHMDNATIIGAVTAAGGSIEMANSGIVGALTTTAGAGVDMRKSSATVVTMTGGSLELDDSNVATAITVVSTSIRSLGSSAGSMGMVSGALIVVGGDLGIIAIDASSSVINCGSASSIVGVGQVIAVGGGSVTDLQDKIVVSTGSIIIKDKLNSSATVSAVGGIILDALAGGTNVTILSTLATTIL